MLEKYIALSIALTKGIKKLLWMKMFLHELGLVQENFMLHYGSQNTIHLGKHINFYFFIKAH